MFTRKTLILALAAAGLIGGGAAVQDYTNATPEEILGFAPTDPALCRVPGAGGWSNRLLFRVAFAAEENVPKPRSETKPFDYVQEGTSPVAGADATHWNDLGSLSYRISTNNAQAQRFFDQGLNLACNGVRSCRSVRNGPTLPQDLTPGVG